MQKMMVKMGIAALVSVASVAHAQQDDGAEPTTLDSSSEETETQAAAAETNADAKEAFGEDDEEQAAKGKEAKSSTKRSSKAGDDGVRFRFGVAGGAGPLMLSDKVGGKVTAVYGGVDTRFGVQINDLVAVYAQPQIGFYNVKDYGALAGTGGLLGISVLGEVTLIDRIFVGAGAGYGILNNPSGPELHFRAGGYPLMGLSKKKVRRKGLMLGVDFRVHFVRGGITGIAPTFNLGYEAF